MTEKDYNPEQKMKKVSKAQEQSVKAKKKEKIEKPIEKEKIDVPKNTNEKKETEEKVEEKSKKPIIKKEIVKKDYAVVNAQSVRVSTKYAMSLCKFVKNKKIEKAIEDLEQVIKQKKAVPMKGEIPHRKGKGIMSGRYPKNASEQFIILLKSLKGNSNANGLENPIIVEAIANMAQRPLARGGIKRKRTHVRLKAVEKNSIKKNKKEKK